MFVDHILKLENLFCFSLSLLLCYSLILSKKFHSSFSIDVLTGPQKIHIESTIRIAGFAVFLSLILSNNLFISKNNEILNLLLLTAFPVFSAGFLEDVTNNVSISKRLISSLISGTLFIYLFDTKITYINIYFVDLLLQNYIFSLIVTILAISVLINAFNLIDGLHGLSIGTFLIMLLGFSIISVIVEDLVLLSLSLTIMMCFLGAFVINFPLGKFFIGDGGAYLMGLIAAAVGIILSEKHLIISPFSIFLIVIFPCYELLRSFFRRILRKKSPFHPDDKHFHSILYKFIVKKKLVKISVSNPLASLLVLNFPLFTTVWACLFFKDKFFILIGIFIFIIIYEILYRSLIKKI